jgi:hypothetical protein
MAGTLGLALSNTRAVVQAFRRKRTAFVRTPKYNSRSRKAASGPDAADSRNSRYAARRISYIAWFEAMLALYCRVGLVSMIAFQEWAAVPFQALFAVGFGLITLFNLQQLWHGRFRS